MRFSLYCALALLTLAGLARAEQVEVQKSDSGVLVTVGGQPFTNYLFKSGLKPILWPMSRADGQGDDPQAWPMREGNPGEKTDHVHQRSLWFTHGNVNGIDFWSRDASRSQARIEHREFVKVEGGEPKRRSSPATIGSVRRQEAV